MSIDEIVVSSRGSGSTEWLLQAARINPDVQIVCRNVNSASNLSERYLKMIKGDADLMKSFALGRPKFIHLSTPYIENRPVVFDNGCFPQDKMQQINIMDRNENHTQMIKAPTKPEIRNQLDKIEHLTSEIAHAIIATRRGVEKIHHFPPVDFTRSTECQAAEAVEPTVCERLDQYISRLEDIIRVVNETNDHLVHIV